MLLFLILLGPLTHNMKSHYLKYNKLIYSLLYKIALSNYETTVSFNKEFNLFQNAKYYEKHLQQKLF